MGRAAAPSTTLSSYASIVMTAFPRKVCSGMLGAEPTGNRVPSGRKTKQVVFCKQAIPYRVTLFSFNLASALILTSPKPP